MSKTTAANMPNETAMIFEVKEFAREVLKDNTFRCYAINTVNILMAIDSIRIILEELGLKGSYYIKDNKYIIIRGHAGLRKILKGTRYLKTNKKILSIGLGKLGQAKSAMRGGVFTIVFTVSLDIALYILDDKQTRILLMKNIAVDVAKAGAALAIGSFLTTKLLGLKAAAWIAATASGPVIVGAALTIGVGLAIDAVAPVVVNTLKKEMSEKAYQVKRHYRYYNTPSGFSQLMRGLTGVPVNFFGNFK